jgi:hypothetical protein
VRPEIANAQWPDDKVIIVTKWIDDLKPSFIPPEFRGEDKTLFPSSVLGQKSKDTVCELLQWSDLIIFDYLPAIEHWLFLDALTATGHSLNLEVVMTKVEHLVFSTIYLNNMSKFLLAFGLY